MQKDGTYSVVPRVPGGEITPEKLIAIGEVARKFGLYTKITGGQRIDLFGAQVHRAAAHLGGADRGRLRVGPCLRQGAAHGEVAASGSTWCRYGVQDSVGLAIELENRYKGLRSPHKIKFGVSGCTRECAEAQGKDVGVIATEKGWNLYVCGNGGMKPRHAELLAGGSRQADSDPLHRPLPDVLHPHGGSAAAHFHVARQPGRRPGISAGRSFARTQLGIAAELEADMARVVGSLRVRVEEGGRGPGDAAALPAFRQQSTPVTATWCSCRSAARSGPRRPRSARRMQEVAG